MFTIYLAGAGKYCSFFSIPGSEIAIDDAQGPKSQRTSGLVIESI